MWFMTDTRYSTEIVKRWQAGVPVRILLDLRADATYPANATVRQSFVNAGIPIRHKTTKGINHWKLILYAGQAKVHFSAANFANGSYLAHHSVHWLRGRGDLFHRRPGGCADVHDEVRRSLDQHHALRESRQRRRGDETLSDLSDGSRAQFPAGSRLREPAGVRDAIGNAGHRCRDVSHHVGQGRGRTDPPGAGGRSRPPHHRPGTVPQSDVLLARVQHRPHVGRGHSRQ